LHWSNTDTFAGLGSGQPSNSTSTILLDAVSAPQENDWPVVLLVDDDPFVLDLWQQHMIGQNLITLTSPEGFAKEIETCRSRRGILCVVTDYYFDNSDSNGEDVAKIAHSLGVTPVFCSSTITEGLPNLELFDGVLEKRPYSREELLKLISHLGSNQNKVS
jgi:hypothetical protein